MSERLSRVEHRLYRQLRQTVRTYQLLEPGDRVLVAMSGGKDSYVMAHLLRRLTARLPFEVELVAVHLDQQQPGYDGRPLVRWLEQSGLRFEVLSEDTYSVVTSHIEEGGTYCALCSRLRRGILYSAAERLGCGKIALGHHADDTLETLLMNLVYSGRMQAMPAIYTTDDGAFQVVRPLVECAEREIAELAAELDFPIIDCNLCGSQDGLRRDRMTRLLDELERESPNVRSVMLNALRNVRPTHLLDAEVLEAWRRRPTHLRPVQPSERRSAHAAAAPVVASTGATAVRRLPLVGAALDARRPTEGQSPD